MIEEKRIDKILLEEMAEEIRMSGGDWKFEELIRLARLGLWAEKHGIPTLREIRLESEVEHGE